MGEAKQRKALDPYYGLKPKLGRGIFLSAPIHYDGRQVTAATSSIDPAELRRAVLFWDRLVWPDSRIVSFGSNYDEITLENEGLLSRPRPQAYNDDAQVGSMSALVRIENSTNTTIGKHTSKYFVDQHVNEFLALDKNEPGQWVMAEGENSLHLTNQNFVPNRGQIVTLARAVPLPDATFPIDELLEFKERRRDEIVSLTFELDKFYSQIANSEDRDFEMNRILRVIDKNCADMIKVARESKRRFHLGDWNTSLSVNNFESAGNRVVAWDAIGSSFGLPVVGGILGAAASFVSFDRGLGSRRLADRQSPFRVVTTMHNELV